MKDLVKLAELATDVASVLNDLFPVIPETLGSLEEISQAMENRTRESVAIAQLLMKKGWTKNKINVEC